MHVVIATDGKITNEDAITYAAPLADDGKITVLTAVMVPRNLLSDLRAIFGEQASVNVDTDGEYVAGGAGSGSGPTGWPGDDAIIDRYLSDKRDERCKPVETALVEHGTEAESVVIEGTNAAKVILEFIATHDVDAVLLGTHGQGLFEGLLGSTSTRVARHASCAVVLVPSKR